MTLFHQIFSTFAADLLTINFMKRKIYEKPSVEVVELKQTVMLMTSPAQAGVQNYTWTTVDEE